MFDRPLWKDWTIWLGVIAAAVVLPGVLAEGNAVDVVFAVAFQLFLFGVVPALIRKAVRRRNRPQS